MGAVALGFIVAVTPWTIQEVVTACTGTKVSVSILLYFNIQNLNNCDI